MATTAAPAHLDGSEVLEYAILEDLQHPRGRTTRTPALIGQRIGVDAATTRGVCDQLERDGLLDRFCGLRLTRAGFQRLHDLTRRT